MSFDHPRRPVSRSIVASLSTLWASASSLVLVDDKRTERALASEMRAVTVDLTAARAPAMPERTIGPSTTAPVMTTPVTADESCSVWSENGWPLVTVGAGAAHTAAGLGSTGLVTAAASAARYSFGPRARPRAVSGVLPFAAEGRLGLAVSGRF